MNRYTNASPLEISALFTLNLLNADDIQPIAEVWLEQELGGDEVACLAFERCVSILDNKDNFEAALHEVLGDIPLSEREAFWLGFRYYLRSVLASQNDELNALYPVIELHYKAGELELFERTDYDEYFAKYKEQYTKSSSGKFAAQEHGIEKLLALYYSPDDVAKWTRKIDRETKTQIRDETKLVLDRFYSIRSELPEALRRVQALVKNENR